ncbi:GNAT family N-acetyltransferase [Micromonospora sp. NPDC049662]|uniref:GNAT family N-acetyltransferase n=1 Tax=Micromonospora sp. NPDC049662 TaxID=3155397 RepID=UPI003431DF7C
MTRKKPARVPPVTADRLLRGWSGPGGTRIRLAAPGDSPGVAELLLLADGMGLDPAVEQGINAGTVASTLLTGLRQGTSEMLRPIAEAAAAGRPDEAMPGLVMVLVAEGSDGRLQGVLQAVPPGNVLSEAHAAGVPLPLALVAATKTAKIQGLAVAEHARGQGLGETLLRRAVRTYFQLGWLLAYGQFSAGSGLEDYYTRQGFTVLPAGEGIDLDRISVPVVIRHEPGERLFTRWRPAGVPA